MGCKLNLDSMYIFLKKMIKILISLSINLFIFFVEKTNEKSKNALFLSNYNIKKYGLNVKNLIRFFTDHDNF